MKRKDFQKGFTLLEILIAIMILTFISFGVYQIINDSITSKDKITKEDRDYLQVESFFARFDNDFSQIYSPLYFDEIEKNRPQVNGQMMERDSDETGGNSRFLAQKTKDALPIPVMSSEKGKIVFLTSGHRRRVIEIKESDYAWVSYELKNISGDNKENILGIVRNFSPENIYSNDFKWDDKKLQLVLPNVKSLEFHFWDEKKKAFVSSLRELSSENRNQVYLLQVKLIWTNVDGNDQTFERSFRPLWPKFKKVKSRSETPSDDITGPVSSEGQN